MTQVYLLEWTFTPVDYFEEAVDFANSVGPGLKQQEQQTYADY